jgi:membrane fusion protein (multidrug efflux system)
MTEVQKMPVAENSAQAEQPSKPDSNVVELPVPASPKRSRRRLVRWSLLILGPLVALGIAGEMYLAGGRYVETDNAYVRAPIMNVTSDVAGTVRTVSVVENQAVQAGHVLFRLDEEPFRIALAGAEAQLGMVRNDLIALQSTYRQNQTEIAQAQTALDYAQTTYDRQRDLSKTGVAAKAALDAARRDLDMATEKLHWAQRQAETTLSQLGGNPSMPLENHPRMREVQAAVDKARRELDHTVIHAPWTGIAANVESLRAGTYLSAGQPAMTLVAANDLWVEANPKETDLAYLNIGDHAEVTVDAYPGIVWKAKVTSVSPATGGEFSVLPAQNASGNWVKVVQRVPVKLALEATDRTPVLRSGMSVNVEIWMRLVQSGRAPTGSDEKTEKHPDGLDQRFCLTDPTTSGAL